MSDSSTMNSRKMPQLDEVLQPYMECCICFGTLYNAASCTPCLHTFCMGCICRWADTNNGKCPMCRVSLKEITPNWVLRDLVKNYLIVRPEKKRQQTDMESLDQSELEYVLKWLGSTDDNILQVESMASLQGSSERCDQKYNNMMTRAVELIGSSVCKEGTGPLDFNITKETIKAALEMLLKDLHKEIMPATLFTKYHRLERAYKKLVQISIPIIGHAEHTWLGNYFIDNESQDQEFNGSDGDPSDDENAWNPGMPARISDMISSLRNPTLPSRRQPRPHFHGFDPVELEALARVQTMRAPGFRRQPLPPVVERVPSLPRRRTTRNRISNNSTAPEAADAPTRRLTRGPGRVPDRPAQDPPVPEQPPVRRSARLAAVQMAHNLLL